MRLVPDKSTSSYDGGRVLLGGSPRRVLRLTSRGADRTRALLAGEPVADDVDAALARRLLDTGLAHPVAPAAPRRSGVDVVVPVYGRAPVASLPDAVVVDDGSPVPLAGAAVRLPVNRGPAAARNAGLAATTSPIVAFVDSDVEVSPDTLGRLAAMLDDDRAVAAVAPRILPAGSRLDLGPRPGPVRPGARTSYLPSTVLVVRRAAVEAVAGFDESLRVGEDVDLVWRLVAAGWTVRYAPELTALHREPPALSARLARSFRYGTSAGPLAHRHPKAPLSPPLATVAAVVFATSGRPRVAAAVLAGAAVGPARRMRASGVRTPDATATAARATFAATTYTSRWIAQLWSPVLGLLAVRALRRHDRVALLALLLTVARRQAVDDLAYGAGVWAGSLRARTARPLLPRLPSTRPRR